MVVQMAVTKVGSLVEPLVQMKVEQKVVMSAHLLADKRVGQREHYLADMLAEPMAGN